MLLSCSGDAPDFLSCLDIRIVVQHQWQVNQGLPKKVWRPSNPIKVPDVQSQDVVLWMFRLSHLQHKPTDKTFVVCHISLPSTLVSCALDSERGSLLGM